MTLLSDINNRKPTSKSGGAFSILGCVVCWFFILPKTGHLVNFLVVCVLIFFRFLKVPSLLFLSVWIYGYIISTLLLRQPRVRLMAQNSCEGNFCRLRQTKY